VRKQHTTTLKASALVFIAICTILIGAWDVFPGAKSQAIATQGQVSAKLKPNPALFCQSAETMINADAAIGCK
jgi:hypothetical protein